MQKRRTVAALAKKKRGVGVLVTGILIAVLFAVGLFAVYMERDDTKNMFDPYNSTQSEAYMDVAYMSVFAYAENSDIKYYYAVDTAGSQWILCMNDGTAAKHQDLIDYYWSGGAYAPQPVRFYGKVETLPADLLEFAMQDINVFLTGDQQLTSINQVREQYYGYTYLNTTRSMPEGVVALMVAIGMGLAMVVWGIITMSKTKKALQATASRYGGELYAVDEELNRPNLLALDKYGIFMTDNYLVTTQGGITVDRLSDIREVFGSYSGNSYMVNVENQQKSRVIVSFTTQMLADGLLREMKERLARFRGVDSAAPVPTAPGMPPAPPVPVGNHFRPAANDAFSLSEDTPAAPGEVVSHNRALGVLGALLGALAGSVVWIILFQMDILASFAGMVIIFGAIYGYRWLAKGMDRTGVVLSLVISAIGVFFANFASYVVAFMVHAGLGFGYAIQYTVIAMQTNGADFWLYLGLGYFFTALVGVPVAISMLGKKKTASDATTYNAPPAAPPYTGASGAPSTPGTSMDDLKQDSHWNEPPSGGSGL